MSKTSQSIRPTKKIKTLSISKGPPLNNHDLHYVLFQLQEKIEVLQERIVSLENTKKKKHTKKEILEHLNDEKGGVTPLFDYSHLLSAFREADLDNEITAFERRENSVCELFSALFENVVDSLERQYVSMCDTSCNCSVPFVSFSSHKNIVFGYDAKSQMWQVVDNDYFRKIIRIAHVNLIAKLNDWKERNVKSTNEEQSGRYQEAINKLCNTKVDGNKMMNDLKTHMCETFKGCEFVSEFREKYDLL